MTDPVPQLLSRHNNQLLVQPTQMGETPAYLTSVTLEWLANRVRFAYQLPLFQPKFDRKTHNTIRDAETIEQLQQRPLDWSRQASLAQYLAIRPHHKFSPILAVISPPWVDDPNAAEWDLDDRATQSAADYTALDPDLGLLDLPPTVPLFALDGQHRLMGVQGLMELIRSGSLTKYKKNKKPTGSVLTAEDLQQHYNVSPTRLQQLSQEKIGIELIPAVIPGETRNQARNRIRSIFVHVNLMAVRLSAGQLALLNEDDGFSIVARRIAIHHPLFKDEPDRSPQVNLDSATVSAKSTVLTTLQALKDMAERYLQHPYPHWKPQEKGLIPLRPEDEELQAGIDTFATLFDYLATLPSYRSLQDGFSSTEMRQFSFERHDGRGNILFRPVGQIALARALGLLVYRHQLSLEAIFAKLRAYDEQDGFSHIDRPQSLWYGVLFDPNKKRIQVAGRELAARLLVYLVNDCEDKLERGRLRHDLAVARSFEGRSLNFDGKWVKPKDVGMPATL
ncbi:DGQHR domain-containing protein [Roseofilum casamattae]|uniref:DGQHR domain-containing protein n=1 Tax=Roseofilum casamattae BLCC-M143 TaxID=3022442 RepID=A0ABT7C1H5_9CYAN|nr:DGQHR domain-containing protein [Roseofilum casamattae]MDJ1185296.1 DGQHR domain-containing protein [Roseofilum casamattae BLCC-M143]